jgi:hypothetical protein
VTVFVDTARLPSVTPSTGAIIMGPPGLKLRGVAIEAGISGPPGLKVKGVSRLLMTIVSPEIASVVLRLGERLKINKVVVTSVGFK